MQHHIFRRLLATFYAAFCLSLMQAEPGKAQPGSASRVFVELRGAYVSGGRTENQYDASSPRFDLDYGNGYGLSLAGGRQFDHLRVAVEMDYMKVGPHVNRPASGVLLDTQIEARDRYVMLLGGVYYEAPVASAVSVYFGGGGGLVSRDAGLVQLIPLPSRQGSIKESSFGFFGEIGLGVAVTTSTTWIAALRSTWHNDAQSTHSTNFWTGLRFYF